MANPFNVIPVLECFSFARREEWSPPLPLGVPRPMNYCSFLVVLSPSNDNSLSFAGSIFFEWIRLRINPCCGATAVLCKRPSLLGHFLDDAFHFSKNAPISQRRAPFGILRCVDNGKRDNYSSDKINRADSLLILLFYDWVGIRVKGVFIWDM
ncbi:hypothetical protein [Dysgonomonas sp. 25]|uniref:hypothetical protein n=1 Tax=Dysgonomonas sp. 25 TaxID=2302933 RepID=UPI0013CF5E62|nr:hypothetical protein [Dysgonomonas sp. 25]NDV67914.1 hypothetical protein [Dysgonomonas sp. 25]